MSNISRNIKSSFYNIADVVLFPVIFFAATPYFIRHLGEDVFGLWMFSNTLIIGFQILNPGLAPSTVKFVSFYNARSNQEKVISVINTNLSLALIIGIIALIAGMFLALGIKYYNLFNLPPSLRLTGVAVVCVLSFLAGLKYLEQVFLNTFKGFEQFDVYFYLNNCARISILIINIIQVNFSQSLVLMLFTNIVITGLMIVIYVLLIKKKYSNYKISFALKKIKVRESLSFGFFTWLQSLIVITVFQLDRYIVINAFGTILLGYYSIIAIIFNHIHTTITACTTWLIPKIASLPRNSKESKSFYFSLCTFTAIIGITSILLFYFIQRPIFTAWLGIERYYYIESYTQLFTVFECFYLLLIAPPLYFNYTGKYKFGTFIIYIVSVLNIIGLIIGYAVTGTVTGMLHGLICSTIAGCFLIYLLINSFFIKESVFIEVFLFTGIAATASIIVLCKEVTFQVLLIIGMLIIFWFLFKKNKKFNLRALFN